jgi:hypothetical protein
MGFEPMTERGPSVVVFEEDAAPHTTCAFVGRVRTRRECAERRPKAVVGTRTTPDQHPAVLAAHTKPHTAWCKVPESGAAHHDKSRPPWGGLASRLLTRRSERPQRALDSHCARDDSLDARLR